MSVAAKQQLIKEMYESVGKFLPVSDADAVVDSLTGLLSRFDIEQTEQESKDYEAVDLLEAFFAAKMIEGRSETTIHQYRYALDHLFEYIKVPVREISVFHLRAYLTSEKERGVSDSTLENKRAVLCAFFGWCHNEGLIRANPCANLAPIKCAKKVRTPYSDTEIERLKENCENDRDRALIQFLLSTGCRVGEVCALNIEDVGLVTQECVVCGKGDKERVVFIDDVAVYLLKKYIRSRTDDSPALFVGRGTDRLTPHGVRCILHAIAEKAGVENVHPHRFRRTLATNMIGRGMPIQDAASILGHDKLDTTMKYVYLSKEGVHNSYRKYA